MRPTLKTFFTMALTLLIPLAAHAADPAPEVFNARAMAMGGATASIVGKTMSARSNPAALVPARGFFAEGSYLTRNERQLDAISLTLVDNKSTSIAGALNYIRVVTAGESEEIGLSLASGYNGYYLGVTGRYAHTRNTRDSDWDSSFLCDLGFLMVSDFGINIGLVGRDILDSSYETLTRRVAVGASWEMGFGLLIAADYVRFFEYNVNEGYTAHAGLEWKPSQTPWAFRVGYLHDAINNDVYYSGGFGWSNQSFEINYAYRQHDLHKTDATHIIGFSMPF